MHFPHNPMRVGYVLEDSRGYDVVEGARTKRQSGGICLNPRRLQGQITTDCAGQCSGTTPQIEHAMCTDAGFTEELSEKLTSVKGRSWGLEPSKPWCSFEKSALSLLAGIVRAISHWAAQWCNASRPPRTKDIA